MPWVVLSRTTCGLSVSRPNDRIGFFSSSDRPSEATGSPASSAAWTRLTTSSSLSCCSRSGRGFLTLASSRSARLVTTPRSAKSISSRKAARSAAGSPPAKAAEDDQEGVPLADQGEPLGVVAVRARHQARRVEHLDGGRRDLLGLVQRGQEVEPGVGQRGDPHLPGMDLARVGGRPGQELEQRALAAPGESDQSDAHGSSVLSMKSEADGNARCRRPAPAHGRGESIHVQPASDVFRLASQGVEPALELPRARRGIRSRWPNRTR